METLRGKYRLGRLCILVVLALSAVQTLLISLGVNMVLVFSAFTPYLLVLYGRLLTGKLPPEYYEGEDMVTLEFLPGGFLIGTIALAVFLLLLYLLVWFFSKNEEGNWMLFGLILYAVDAVIMLVLFGIEWTLLFHYVLHGIVIGALASATSSGIRLRQILRARRRATPQPPQVSRYLEDE
jgi:hypothetical protein